MTAPQKVLACGLIIGVMPAALAGYPNAEPDQLIWLITGYGLSALLYLYVWRFWRTLSETKKGLLYLVLISAVSHSLLAIIMASNE